jgi:hypothetical protein
MTEAQWAKPVTRAPRMRAGDIVVTRVAHHYSLGRVNADGDTETPVDVASHRPDALVRACLLAGTAHEVFLRDDAGSCAAIPVDCRVQRHWKP